VSAILALVKADAVELITDAASVWVKNGRVESFLTKQFFEVPRVVIGIHGLLYPGRLFAGLAGQRCATFDELVEQAAEIWQEARIESEFGYSICFAGWSEKRQALELWSAAHCTTGFAEYGIWCNAQTPEACELLDAMIEPFAGNPETFSASHDGIFIMERLRACRRQFADGQWQPCVGGAILHTVVRREGVVASDIIHRWPDRVGHVIQSEVAAV
jgi:hypothetical protein